MKLAKMTFVFAEIIMNLIKKMNGEDISKYEGVECGGYNDYAVDKIFYLYYVVDKIGGDSINLMYSKN